MIVGRGDELSEVMTAIAGATRGDGAVLQLTGPPGVGKSTIVDTAVSGLEGHRVVRIGASSAETDVAWAGLSTLVMALRDTLALLSDRPRDLLAGLVGWGPRQHGDDVATGMACLAMLIAAAEPQPLVVVVDDERYLDPDSRRVFEFVARRVVGLGVAVIAVTTRTNPALARLGPVVEVGDLDVEQAVALVRARGVVPHVAGEIVARCGTRPLVLVDVVNRLLPEQRNGAAPLPSPLTTGVSLVAEFADRVGQLPAVTRRALLVLALGGADDGRRALDTLELGDDDLIAAERVGLVHLTADGIVFVHPTVAEAVIAAATVDERRATHRSIAAMLESVDPSRARWHRARAAVGPDERLARELEEAAERASALGHAYDALRVWGQAAVVGAPGVQRTRRWLRAADAALQARLVDAAESLLDHVGDAGSDARLIRARVAQARGDLMRARGEFVALVLDEGAPDEVRRAAQIDAAVLSLRMYDLVTATRLTEPAAYEGSDPETARRLAMLYCAAWASLGDSASARTLVDQTHQALAAPTTARDVQILAEACALALARAGRHPELMALSEMLMSRVNESGVPSLATPLLIAQAAANGRADLSAAMHAATAAVTLIEEWGQDEFLVFALTHRANALAGFGDPAALEDADRIEAYGGPLAEGAATVVRAAYHRTAEDFEAVVACAEPAHRQAGREPPLSVMFHLDLFEAALVTGRTELADDVRETMVASLQRTGSAWIRAGLERIDGLLADDPVVAVDHLRRSVQLFDGGGYAVNAGRSELLAARRLALAGDAVQSAAMAASARRRFEHAGMSRWVAFCDRLVSPSAEQVPVASQAASADAASMVLTPRELQVARWIVDGFTYREIAERLFVSQRTVESHGQSIYRKLEVRGRRGLAARALADATLRVAGGSPATPG